MKAREAREPEDGEARPACEAVSLDDEACNHPAGLRCPKCGLWICEEHMDDDAWHACALEEGEEGGEG